MSNLVQMSLTNEEQRVAFYALSEEPTVAAAVTPDTPLELLNLNWRERDLPERERTKHVHRLHPYLGKFIPQLVEVFLRKYFLPGETVLDPFCGSGTTLVQANELGIKAIGYDISAFNVMLTRAKTARYDLKQLNAEALDILDKVEQATQRTRFQLPLWGADAPQESAACASEYLRRWFAPQALGELVVYRDLIPQYRYQDLLRVILSRSARSARLTTHFDLDFPKAPQTEPYYCYKHSRICTPTTAAYPFLRRYTLDTIERIRTFSSLRTVAEVTVRHEDSRLADLSVIDGVVTSPPYVGLIDYHEQHRYAYELLGLEDKSEAEIGPACRGSGQKARAEYQAAIASVFSRACQVMRPGGHLIVVAGDRHGLYGEIAQLAGVGTEAVVNRHVNRRTGRRSSEFYESVFIWRKP